MKERVAASENEEAGAGVGAGGHGLRGWHVWAREWDLCDLQEPWLPRAR